MASVQVVVALSILGAQLISGLPLYPGRLTQNEWTSYFDSEVDGPGTYAFGYDVEDPLTGNIHYRLEERLRNGTVIGSYGLLEPNGNVRIVHYRADETGYSATVENSLSGTFHYPPVTSGLGNPPLIEGEGNRSPQLAAAIQSVNNLGQPVQEQHTPPKYVADGPPSPARRTAYDHLQSRMKLYRVLPSRDVVFK